MAKKKQDPGASENASITAAGSSVPDTARLVDPPMGVGRAMAICVGGWLVPGASHLILGRWGRGVAFTASVLAMFVLGLAMQGRLYAVPPEQPLHLFAFVADAGVGLPNYDYGTTFLWVAGLLNYLIVLDAFDISRGRKP
jgi:uncharacterized membrane protein YphA (DoxX/SURF4 family)